MKRPIAVVTTSYPSIDDDVSGHFVRSEVQQLVAAGSAVTVLCPGRCSSERDRPADAGVTVIRLGGERLFGWPGALVKLRADPLAALSLLGFVDRARAFLREHEFDRVIAHWLLGSGWPIALAATAPIEVVVHGSDARLLQRLGPARGAILRALERKGCTLRLVAPHLKPLLATGTNRAWLETARVEPLPVSVPTLASRETLRAELGVAADVQLAVIAGRLVASKRIHVALNRAPFLARTKKVVVGSGPLSAELERDFPDVLFTGQLPREQALQWIKAADVVISASLEEGAPTVLREARRLGTHVWTAEFGSAAAWAATDPGVTVLAELS